ncbi:MAG: MFS transporter [Patescibacteria group bacterium]
MFNSVRGLMFLVGTYYFLQAMGGNPGLHTQALQKTAKELWHYSPAESAAFFAFLTIPWVIKPLYGIISDFLPIFGSRRKSYFILTAILASGSYAAIAWLGFSDQVVKLLLFNAAIGIAFSDVLCDAVMVEKGQRFGATAKLQSAQWFALGAAGVLIAFFKGYIAEFYSLAQAVRLSLAAPILGIAVTVVFLKEEKVISSGEAARNAWRGIKDAIRLKPLWAAACFIFLFQMSPNFGAALYYYEKDALKFSDVLIGHIDTVGSIGFVLGTFLFGLISQRISHEKMLRAIMISGVVSTLAYLLFVNAASAFIVSAFAGVVAVVAFLGILNIAATVCPKNAEGTVFALLMSISNFGSQLGAMSGGKLYETIGYSWLVLISAAFTACMWFFLPLVRQK